MTKKYEKEAETVKKAILELSKNEYSLDNFEAYLSYNFREWLEKFARTPAELAGELKCFSEIK